MKKKTEKVLITNKNNFPFIKNLTTFYYYYNNKFHAACNDEWHD